MSEKKVINNKRTDDRIEDLRLLEDKVMRIYDFSKGGIGIFLRESYPVDSLFSVNVNVGGEKLSLKARVAHCTIYGNSYRTGLKYEPMNGDTERLLHNMVSQYSRGVTISAELQHNGK